MPQKAQQADSSYAFPMFHRIALRIESKSMKFPLRRSLRRRNESRIQAI
jgi:hypothetical protein